MGSQDIQDNLAIQKNIDPSQAIYDGVLEHAPANFVAGAAFGVPEAIGEIGANGKNEPRGVEEIKPAGGQGTVSGGGTENQPGTEEGVRIRPGEGAVLPGRLEEELPTKAESVEENGESANPVDNETPPEPNEQTGHPEDAGATTNQPQDRQPEPGPIGPEPERQGPSGETQTPGNQATFPGRNGPDWWDIPGREQSQLASASADRIRDVFARAGLPVKPENSGSGTLASAIDSVRRVIFWFGL